MKKSLTLFVDQNTKLSFDQHSITILQGRNYITLAISTFAGIIAVLCVVFAAIKEINSYWISFLPLLIALNGLVYVSVQIDLAELKINKTYKITSKVLYTGKSVIFSTNELQIRKVEGDETVDYLLEVNGAKVLLFNSFDTASNVQRIINQKTGILIMMI